MSDGDMIGGLWQLVRLVRVVEHPSLAGLLALAVGALALMLRRRR